jgi:uncharacterized membrane protein
LRDKIFHGVLQYIGPAENVAKYKYKMEFVNEGSMEGVSVTRLARSFAENLNDT